MHRVSTNRRVRVTLLVGALVAVSAFASAPRALAVSTSFWKMDSFAEAAEGRLDGTSVLHDGRVVLSSEFREVQTPDVQYVWSGAGIGNGEVVVVVGTPGRVLRLGDDDPVELLTLETADFPAMAVSDEGYVFVGTAPGGEVYRIDSEGESALFFETGEGYIWSMAYSPDHGLLVGTGDKAAVYAVDENGSGSVIYESNDASVSALAVVDDRVLAGTGIDGLLLDITPGSDLRVLSDTSYDEISGVVRGADGAVYFSATSVSLEDVLDEGGGYGSGFGDGAVFRMTEAGSAIEVWHSPEAPVTSLGLSHDGSVLAGTGAGGLIYAVGSAGSVDLVAELPGEEVLSIGGEGGIIVTVGAPGGVYRMGRGAVESGEYESEVFDARSASTWGELSWTADVPGGAKVELFVRSGNMSDPDDTWSDWELVVGDGGGRIGCPHARFFQWKARLTRGARGASPELLSVEAAYLRENLPPLITAVVVHEPGDVVTVPAGGEDASSVSQTLPGGIEVSYSLTQGGPDGRELPVLLRGMRTASWDALDPNGDALTFDVFVKSDDEDDWKLIDEDVFGRTLHTWDAQSMTDGVYRMKVTATDRRSNSRELAMVVEDLASQVMFVDVSVDYGPWKPAFADDGMFDSRGESFRLVIEGLEPGEHAVSIRAADRSGNPVVVRRVSR